METVEEEIEQLTSGLKEALDEVGQSKVYTERVAMPSSIGTSVKWVSNGRQSDAPSTLA